MPPSGGGPVLFEPALVVNRLAMREDKLKKLRLLLSAIPERYVGQLTEAVETDRLAGGALPHGEMLDALRPKLRKSGKKRKGLPSVSRVAYEPIQDLFVQGHGGVKRTACIARTSLAPVWSWVETDLMPQEMRGHLKSLRKAILSQDAVSVGEAAAAVREKVSMAIGKAFAGAAPKTPIYDALVQRLGGENVVEDAREIGLLMAAAPTFIQVRELIPECSKRLSDAELKALRGLYDELAHRLPDPAVYIPVIAMRRLARPWQMMDVLRILGRVENDTALAQTTLGLGGDLLLDELQDHATFLCASDLGSAETTEILRRLGIFADASAGMSQAFDIKRIGPWGQKLAKIRKQVSDNLERRVERLPDRLIGAFPVIASGRYGSKGVARPDISRWPDEAKIAEAINLAVFLEGSRWDANKALFSTSHRTAVDQVGRFLISYADHLVNEIRSTQSDSEDRKRSLAHLDALVRCTELVLGSQEADILRRRRQNAVGGPAAA